MIENLEIYSPEAFLCKSIFSVAMLYTFALLNTRFCKQEH